MISKMDTIRLGQGIRALRRRRGWRQEDLAKASGTSRTVIARIELGAGDRVTARTLEKIAQAAGARIMVRLTWNGEALDRLLDSAHAALVEVVVARLERNGWEVVPEVSFNVFGERGSIDVLGFHHPSGCLLVVEVKSAVPDVQATLVALDRKARLAQRIARERGWQVASVGRLLAIGEDRTSRRRVTAFEATFRHAFPVRGRDVDRWVRSPDPAGPMSGIRFLTGVHQTNTRHRVARRSRRGSAG